jgi:hypothetical protein
MRSIAVLFPAPFGPMSPVTCPNGAWNEQPLTAMTPPKCFVSPRTSSAAVVAGVLDRFTP